MAARFIYAEYITLGASGLATAHHAALCHNTVPYFSPVDGLDRLPERNTSFYRGQYFRYGFHVLMILLS